ncbi:MAG: ATP-dependent DNA helicase [Leifsonia xyli]|nr:MAG: ATP-dependent DNA helicase [Leifsonia xyli]
MTDERAAGAASGKPADAGALSAFRIAEALGLPPPTEQQRAIIEAAPDAPALVVAGAGSGKTETMAGRALWLIANGHATPGEILGLTFTRKAAGELAVRMAERVAALRRAGLMPEMHGDDPASELLDAPRVSTYNSFAAAIFRDHAALLGYDGDGVVLGEAAAWLLARRIVVESEDPRLAELELGVDAVTGAVLSIARALGENLADPARVAAYAADARRLSELPPGGRGAYAEVESAFVDRVTALPLLLDLAARFQAAKFERGFSEFSDQIATAMRIIERTPEVALALRAQYRFVILDEYQDTSVSQTRLLAAIFRGHPVMAVGDPHQSIYGWRGASASNLAEFAGWFDADTQLSLSTSWRNGVHILEAANTLIAPLSALTPVPVAELSPRPGADAVPVECVFPETVTEEAREVAQWFRELLRDPALQRRDDDGQAVPPSAALLLRARANLEHYLEAFRAAGVRYHVLGVGGLLAEPVVADVVAALAVIARADSGSELIRLLLGSRWRLGARDVATLHGLARWLEKRDLRQQPLDEAVAAALRASVAGDESASLVDALDFLASAPENHRVIASLGFSELGLERLRDAGRTFAELRRRARLPLGELATLVIERLDLDIEVAANETRTGGAAALEGFFDAVASFEQLGAGAGVADFLGWLREAQSRERLTPRSEAPEPGCVQVLTIHGSKGLEWDLVAVPRLVEGELPNPSATSTGWLTFGGFPYEFRGDRDALPVFDWRSCTTRKEVVDRLKAFKDAERERLLLEDRRLAYVAVTRARSRLLLAGSFWASQTKPRKPSRFLAELVDAAVIPGLPDAPLSADANPLSAEAEWVPWPRDPLGSRRARVEAAAAAVARSDGEVTDAGLARELELLLAEHRRRLAGRAAPPPPARVPASRFADYVESTEQTLAQLARPMPERPYRATRLGTVFHAWVENRAMGTPTGGFDELDDLDLEAADELIAIDAENFARLRATFESSPWAELQPVEVEREIHLPFDGRVVICKIDAVYQHGERFEVVDWKTGKAPKDAADLERKQLQLALYRLAYARWTGIDPALVDAAFYFVAENRVIRPEHIDTEEELLARWRGAFGAAG